jgi:hypothetical protein
LFVLPFGSHVALTIDFSDSVNIANMLALGFNSATDQLLWTFFTSFTLALLSAFQAACFFLAFYRVVRATINQRQIETSGVDAVLLSSAQSKQSSALLNAVSLRR